MMENPSATPPGDEIAKAIEVLRRASTVAPAVRGDSFDIGTNPGMQGDQMGQMGSQVGPYTGGGNSQDIFVRLMQNPESISGLFGLTPRQARNIRSLIVGGGAGGIHRVLADSIGDELAGALGGFAAAWLAKKLVK